ncbi:MAG: hypothetical protein QOI79_2382 [Mycobacterium sp.]|nr:hypothetical protein [Mycobacterium sp.]
MPTVARTPHRADRPAWIAVVVAGQAARRRHNRPSALSLDQIAHEVIREVVTTPIGHAMFYPEPPTDRRGARTVSAMTQPPPPAPGWYPDPSGAGSRCWDGRTNWGPAAPPPAVGGLPKKKQSLPKWVIVFAVIAVLMVIGEAGSHSNNSSSTSISSSTATSAAIAAAPPATNTAPPPLAGIGQEVRDGKFAFVATSVDQSKTAGDPSNRVETVTAQGEFVNVHLNVSNVGDQAQSFFASNQKLQIGDKQFSANDTAAMWIGSMTIEINPGNSIQALVSFDVAPGTSNDGVLTVHDSIFSGGAKISLQQPGQ